MRTSLEYLVDKEEEFDFDKGKVVSRVKNRYFDFCVSGCKTEEEHNKAIDSFRALLDENDIEYDEFTDYNKWEEAIKYDDEKAYNFISIHIDMVEDKDYIRSLYKEWKTKKEV